MAARVNLAAAAFKTMPLTAHALNIKASNGPTSQPSSTAEPSRGAN
jgi:hypothetical protein